MATAVQEAGRFPQLLMLVWDARPYVSAALQVASDGSDAALTKLVTTRRLEAAIAHLRGLIADSSGPAAAAGTGEEFVAAVPHHARARVSAQFMLCAVLDMAALAAECETWDATRRLRELNARLRVSLSCLQVASTLCDRLAPLAAAFSAVCHAGVHQLTAAHAVLVDRKSATVVARVVLGAASRLKDTASLARTGLPSPVGLTASASVAALEAVCLPALQQWAAVMSCVYEGIAHRVLAVCSFAARDDDMAPLQHQRAMLQAANGARVAAKDHPTLERLVARELDLARRLGAELEEYLTAVVLRAPPHDLSPAKAPAAHILPDVTGSTGVFPLPASTAAPPPASAPLEPAPAPVAAPSPAPAPAPVAAPSPAPAPAPSPPAAPPDGHWLPPTPTRPRAVEVTDDAVTLEWELDGGGAMPPRLLFALQWRRVGRPLWNPMGVVGTLRTKKDLLSPATGYEFRVCGVFPAEDGGGSGIQGDFSPPSDVIVTLAAVPSPPVALSATVMHSTAPPSLVVTWAPPHDAEPATGVMAFVAVHGAVLRILLDGSLNGGDGSPRRLPPLPVPPVGSHGRCKLIVSDDRIVGTGTVRVALVNAQGVGAMSTCSWAVLKPDGAGASTVEELARSLALPASDSGHYLGEVDPEEIVFDSPRVCLGTGGFGSVFRTAVGGFSGRTAAVKELHPSSSNDDLVLAMLQEMAVMKPLTLLKVYGFSLQAVPLYVMEFADGGSLWDLLYRPPQVAKAWSLVQRLVCMLQIADAMAYLHARRIVHRDLKPNNVVCSTNVRSGGVDDPDALPVTPKVCDFGLARVRGSSGIATTVGGSFPYLAPEAFHSDVPITEKVDVYSFAVMLNEILSGVAPWQGLDQYQITMAVAVERRRPNIADVGTIPVSHNPALSSSTCAAAAVLPALIAESWRHDPADRPAFDDVVGRLRKLLKAIVDDV